MDESNLTILYVAFGLYSLLLCAAAAFDTWKFIIPNAITVALIVLFIVTALLLPIEMNLMDWLSHVGAAAAMLVGGAILFAFNKMSGGDVKLLTAVAFWAGFDYLVELLLYVAIAGGGLAIVLIVLRRLILSLRTAITGLGKVKMPRVLLEGEAVPYGLAIAPTSIYLGTQLPHLGAYI